MALEVVLPQIRGGDGAEIIGKADEKRGPNEPVQRNRVDRLTIVEEVSRRVGVRAGVRAEANEGDVCSGAFGHGLLERDLYLRVPRIHESARTDRHGDIENAAHSCMMSNCRARFRMADSWTRWRSG